MPTMARGGRIHIVLLPNGPLGESVLDAIANWAAAGLLEPAFWIRDQDVRKHDFLPASILATVMGRLGDGTFERREVPLLATLGRESVKEVIVTGLRWIGEDLAASRTAAESADRLLFALEQALPHARSVDGTLVPGTDMRSLNLVFAGTRVTSDQLADLLSDSWHENIIVSPEDRQRPSSADRFTESADIERWAGFIAASCASLAGVWAGMSSTPIRSPSGSGNAGRIPHVRVARTFSRVVLSQGLAVHLATVIVEQLQRSTSPMLNAVVANHVKGMTLLDPASAERDIGRGVEFLIHSNSDALMYHRPETLPTAPKDTVSWWQARKAFLRFSADKLKAIPSWTQAAIAQRISRRATEKYYGADGATEVDARRDFGLEEFDRDLLEPLKTIVDLRAQVLRAINTPQLPATRGSAPGLWSDLSNVIFVLCDGSTDNDQFKPATDHQGRVMVLADVSQLIPVPGDSWLLPADAATRISEPDRQRRIGWAELARARDIFNRLDARNAALAAELTELREAQEKALEELATAERTADEASDALEDIEQALMHDAETAAGRGE